VRICCGATRAVLQMTGANNAPSVAVSTDERAVIATSKSAVTRGEFACDGPARADAL